MSLSLNKHEVLGTLSFSQVDQNWDDIQTLVNQINSRLPQNNWQATTDPTTSNDQAQGYVAGSRWYNKTTGDLFICTSAATGAAVWVAETTLTFADVTLDAVTNAGNTTNNPIIVGALQATQLNGGPFAGLRNRLINGNFDVWQRGTSFTTGGIYTADRWRAAGASGQTVTRISDHPTQSTGFCAEVVNTSGSQWLEQRIESSVCRDLAGKEVTFSAWVKNVSAGPIGAALNLEYATAADNFASATSIGSSSPTTSTEWTLLTFTTTVPAGGANGLRARVITSAGAGGAATVRVAAAQIERGPVATNLEIRAFPLELSMCQRYYYRMTINDAAAGVGFCDSATQAPVLVPFPARMRAVPSSLETTGTATDYRLRIGGIVNVVCSVVPSLLANNNTDNGWVLFTVASGLTAGQAVTARGAASAAYLGWSAEL